MSGGEKTEEVTQRTTAGNSELDLEENVLSKWREQGALRNESIGFKLHSEIDRKR